MCRGLLKRSSVHRSGLYSLLCTMSSVKNWSTKEQVLKDLSKASGRRIGDLDEGYLVIGDAPPPIIIEDDEDIEMQLMFGEAASKKDVQTVDESPDLLGIQQMLRMVQDYNDGDEDMCTPSLNTVDATKPSDCVITIAKVSSLNPTVPEFIPKRACLSSQITNSNYDTNESSNNVISESIKANVITQTVDVNLEETREKDSNDNDVNIVNNGFEEMATKLKSQICDAARTDSFEIKKQKNVAIATLLRLYATNSPTKTPQKVPEPLKLITPEFFEAKNENKSDGNIKVVASTPSVSSQISTSSTPEPRNSSTTRRTCSTYSISTTPAQTISSSEINSRGSNSPKSPVLQLDPDIKRSIQKVNKWLNKPAKILSQPMCIGPIAFKRKDTTQSCQSPVSDTEQKVKKCPSVGQRYQPSNYAADLGKKYMERNKVLECHKKDVTWTNLNTLLKEKDIQIKKRLEEQASASESNNDSVVGQR